MLNMIVYFLYDVLLLLATPIIIGYHLFRSLTRGRPVALFERFGFLPSDQKGKIAGFDTIWVHAVSVGETIAVKTLLKAIKERFPQKKIVLSNVTETGRSISLKLAEADLCIYFPFDYGFAARRAISSVSPSLIIIVETEIWPNFLRAARKCNVPVILANGRISDKSFKSYNRLKWVFRRVLRDFSALCMQTQEDARRIISMGAQSSRVYVSKNLKYDVPVAGISQQRFRELRDEYLIPQSLTVITAGSTHQGEEELLAQIYRNLMADERNLLLVLAPRHPERVEKVSEILQKEGIPCALRSKLDARTTPFRCGEVLVLDTVGELTKLYSISDIVFVGGSLIPVGGHNILEPAALHVPVLFGPFMNNFKEIAALILKFKGGVQVANEAELEQALRSLLDDEDRRREMGRNGARLLEENSGSTERHMEIIASFI
ncbi:MAG TPA: 3-deoxy-D-manno-octulosonic acid transferase [Geobacteraceae bacterium]|nr:3-deoxy-D-manno-octulosonic acid transferase [Geobacteraceae bacterium]